MGTRINTPTHSSSPAARALFCLHTRAHPHYLFCKERVVPNLSSRALYLPLALLLCHSLAFFLALHASEIIYKNRHCSDIYTLLLLFIVSPFCSSPLRVPPGTI